MIIVVRINQRAQGRLVQGVSDIEHVSKHQVAEYVRETVALQCSMMVMHPHLPRCHGSQPAACMVHTLQALLPKS